MIGRRRGSAVAALTCVVIVAPVPTADASPLTPEAVLASSERHHPRVMAALMREEIAEAELRAARGNFDPQLGARGAARSGGYYELRRLDAELRQPTSVWGAEVYAGYRMGIGAESDQRYPTYYDDQTLSRGEVRAGIWVPLWRDGPLDARRAERRRAIHRLDAAGEDREAVTLELRQRALEAYWAWVAAGRRLAVAEQLLALAEARLAQTRARAADGAIAPVDALEAENAVLARGEMRLRARRALEASALLLGLFVRDGAGAPSPPRPSALPDDLVLPLPLAEAGRVAEGLVLDCHPRLGAARASLRALEVDRDLARAQRAPQLDVGLEVSRDFGEGNESLRGTVFESRARFSMPLLMRTPRARLEAAEQRLLAEREELRLLEDALRIELEDVISEWHYARERFEVARTRLGVARRLAEAERDRFDAGTTDLLFVNLREQTMAEAEVALVDAAAELWRARVRWDALTACVEHGS
jgi:outer membrane protein, heavy metal efflux system